MLSSFYLFNKIPVGGNLSCFIKKKHSFDPCESHPLSFSFRLHFPLHRKLHCQKKSVRTTGIFICENKTSKYVDLVVCFRSGEKHALSKREQAKNFDCENKTSKYVRFRSINHRRCFGGIAKFQSSFSSGRCRCGQPRRGAAACVTSSWPLLLEFQISLYKSLKFSSLFLSRHI